MSPGLLFFAYGAIAVAAVYGFVYIPNKKKHRKIQELHDFIRAGDVVVIIGGVVGKVAKKEGECLTLIIDEEKGVTMKVVLYVVGQKIERRENTQIGEG